MARIFLSHSHIDGELAHELAVKIREVLGFLHEDVFVASEPDAIPSGDWTAHVLEELKDVQVFIPLITPSSEKSLWVAFEYGNFWARKEGKSIHPLVHPKADVSAFPWNEMQAKYVTDREQLEVFFEALCDHFNCDYPHSTDLDSVVQRAMKTPTITLVDRQFQLLCKLQLIVATSLEVKDAIFRWMGERDILHDAQLAWLGDLQEVHFPSPANMQRINLGGNDLRGARFWESNLEDAILGSTKLQGTNFQYATLQGASFQGAELDENTTLPDGSQYKPESGLQQLEKSGAVIDR